MPIPESQLEVWSHQGSITQSAATYKSISNALESTAAPYRDRRFEIFLNGSYGNDTNIYSESDVDVVAHFHGAFYHNIEELSVPQRVAFNQTMPDGSYGYNDFRDDVGSALDLAFPGMVTPGNKVFDVAATKSRRKADVLVAFEYRRYRSFTVANQQDFVSGICFWRRDNVRVVNYPQLHSYISRKSTSERTEISSRWCA